MNEITGKSASLIVRQAEPFNAEPNAEALRRNIVTPNDLFFVRNHGTIPNVDIKEFRLTLKGLIERELSLSLDDLRNDFERHEISATLQCAGNRRDELISVKPIEGETPWSSQAISNAVWCGVRLRDVLARVGISNEARHVAFVGLDEVVRHEKTFGFGGSIPLDKALSDEVLLAFEMNGEPLLPTHGFPIRVVVAGFIGARSVKWLSEISLQTEPSDNYFQQHAYKLFPANINAETVDWTTGAMLGEQSLTSVICTPAKNSKISGNIVMINGFAIAGGGRRIERVEISNDNGATWKTTNLENNQDEKAWAWTFWQTQIELPIGEHEICVRAFDSASNTQPENAANLWNFKGYMNNAWHRIKFEMVEN